MPGAAGRSGGAQTKSRRPRRCPRSAEPRPVPAAGTPGAPRAAPAGPARRPPRGRLSPSRDSGWEPRPARAHGPVSFRGAPSRGGSDRGGVGRGCGRCGRALPVGSAAGSRRAGAGAGVPRGFPLSPAACSGSAGGAGGRRAESRRGGVAARLLCSLSVLCEVRSGCGGAALDSELISFLLHQVQRSPLLAQ